MEKFITACLVIVGLINFLPVVGLLGAKNLESAYGISLASNDLLILMRHRALLFGLLGGFILYAAFIPAYQTAAILMAAISMIGYVLLALTTQTSNQALARVLTIDYVGIFFLSLAVLLKYGFKDN